VRDDGYEAQVRAEAAELGDRVIFTGHAEDARALMSWFDVLAVPSLEEPFATAAAEALAAGTPVVATRSGGVEEYLVPGETGELVPVGDPGTLGAAINGVLGRTDDMEAACVAAVERFDAERVTADVASAFGEALDAGT
jgi:glycosyltransferase involved in cell wall biosynthesis